MRSGFQTKQVNFNANKCNDFNLRQHLDELEAHVAKGKRAQARVDVRLLGGQIHVHQHRGAHVIRRGNVGGLEVQAVLNGVVRGRLQHIACLCAHVACEEQLMLGKVGGQEGAVASGGVNGGDRVKASVKASNQHDDLALHPHGRKHGLDGPALPLEGDGHGGELAANQVQRAEKNATIANEERVQHVGVVDQRARGYTRCNSAGDDRANGLELKNESCKHQHTHSLLPPPPFPTLI